MLGVQQTIRAAHAVKSRTRCRAKLKQENMPSNGARIAEVVESGGG
jgi:hypothetical protein